MYICVCNALTDRDVRSAEAAGAAREAEVFRHFGVTAQCGRCVPCMRSLLGNANCLSAGERRHANDAAPLAAVAKSQDR